MVPLGYQFGKGDKMDETRVSIATWYEGGGHTHTTTLDQMIPMLYGLYRGGTKPLWRNQWTSGTPGGGLKIR